MTASGWLQIVVLIAVLSALTPLLGGYIHRVFSGERVLLARAIGPAERSLTRLLAGAQPAAQDWRSYAASVLAFSGLCWLALFVILRTQGIEPLNPQGFGAPPWNLSFNAASSFISNTGWQFYGGESTLSNFSQMAGVTVHAFLSGAVGLAVAIAITRGFANRIRQRAGKLLGGPRQRPDLRAVAAGDCGVAVSHRRGIGPDARGERPDLDARRRAPDARPRTGGLTKVITLLGTLGAGFFGVNSAMPFEDPDWPHELRGGADGPGDPGGADLDLRANRGQPPAGLGALRRDGGDAARGGGGRLLGRGPALPSDARRRRARPEHGGQGAALHRRRTPRSRRSPGRRRAMARPTRRSTRTRASGARSRWPT